MEGLLQQLPERIGWFVGCVVFFYAIEALFPAIKGQKLLRKDTGTDVVYWFVTPVLTFLMVRGLLLTLIWIGLTEAQSGAILRGQPYITAQPTWLISLEALLVSDLLIYWIHRFWHRFVWPVHAVHHSSKKIDWLSSVRMHPIDSVVGQVLQAVVLAVVGFPLTVATGLLFLVIPLQSYLTHANIKWDFGPLKYVFVTPRFHRWHHTFDTEAREKNFGRIFVFWDLLFGTYYQPKRKKPERFGTGEVDEVPGSFLGQLIHPFKVLLQRAN